MARRTLVETPTLGACGGVIGKPRKLPPADAAARIETLAAEGHSQLGVAIGMRTCSDVLKRWLEDDPTLKEAFERGRERERYALHNTLFKKATEEGNIVAALFLLKARHGYREGEQAEQGNRVSINFTLPGALRPAEFVEVMKHESDT